jgi:hypothetical protein
MLLLALFGPPLVGVIAFLVFAQRCDTLSRRLDPKTPLTPILGAWGSPPRGARGWLRYLASRILAIAAVVAVFRTNKLTASLVLAAVAAWLLYQNYRTRIAPLRARGASRADTLTLIALLAVWVLALSAIVFRFIAERYRGA